MSELSIHSDEHFMRQALMQAELGADAGEIPVGAVVVVNNRIIAKAHNQVEQLTDATAHAEMLAVTAAQNYLGAKYLDQCTLYVSLEPCTMCAGALFWTQIERIVIAARDADRGFSRLTPTVLHPNTQIEFGLMAQDAEDMIKSFFKALRKKSS